MGSMPSTTEVHPQVAVPTQGAGDRPGAPIGWRQGERSRRQHGDGGHRAFVPLLLLVIAGLAWPGFQCYQLVNERQALATVFGSQNRQVEESTKLRGSLDAIARDTAILAGSGNAGAKLIVDELAKRGVTINPAAASASAASEK